MGSVQVRNVKKVYQRDKQQIPVLDGISLDVAEGDFIALMGPSGSGKTTLLNLIGGIDQPTSGDVVVGGTSIGKLDGARLAKWRSRNIGFIFQLYNLIPVLTAFEISSSFCGAPAAVTTTESLTPATCSTISSAKSPPFNSMLLVAL